MPVEILNFDSPGPDPDFAEPYERAMDGEFLTPVVYRPDEMGWYQER
ncbi:MAG: hypothetical protein ACP5E4_01680 [Candidatus Aenigmatarchaeota archaeon]